MHRQQLEATFLRRLSPEQAREHLKTLPGIDDFSAQLIQLRGAGEPYVLSTHEPRLARAMTLAYGLDHLPTTQDVNPNIQLVESVQLSSRE